MSWHKHIIVGRLGRDAELRFTPQGKAVANFSLASDTGWGEYKTTMWTRVSVWGNQAESLTPYLVKGKQVLVSGEMQVDPETGGPRVWTGSDGVTKASFEMTAREIRLLGGKGDVEIPSEGNSEPKQDEIPF